MTLLSSQIPGNNTAIFIIVTAAPEDGLSSKEATPDFNVWQVTAEETSD